MKKVMEMLMVVAAVTALGGAAVWADGPSSAGTPQVDVDNTLNSSQWQQTSVVGGGDADATSSSSASAEGGTGMSWSNAEGGIGMSDSDCWKVLENPGGQVE